MSGVCRDNDPKEAEQNTRHRRHTVQRKPLNHTHYNILILCVLLCRTHHLRRVGIYLSHSYAEPAGVCLEENNGFLVLRQPFSGWSIPALSAEDSPMNVCVLGHITATRWPTVQTRGEFNVHCEIVLVHY